MNYTNDMKYRHILRKIQQEYNNPSFIKDEISDLTEIISSIVWSVEGTGKSFDEMVEESMELERTTS